jgi:hypothetical protein
MGQEFPAFWSDPIPQINIYTTLTNLQFALKFIRHFIIRECAFRGDEVENFLMVPVVADLPAYQLSISYHTSYVWSALKQKLPLAFYLVHFPCVSQIHSKGSESKREFLVILFFLLTLLQPSLSNDLPSIG